MRVQFVAAALTSLATALCSTAAHAQSEPFVGQLMLVPYAFCPNQWTEAAGQTLQIRMYAALYSVIGVQFGGDGVNTFNLPDLRGRTPIGQGQGPGLPNYLVGSVGGAQQVTLTADQMPDHTHQVDAEVRGAGNDPNSSNPGNAALAAANIYAKGGTADIPLSSSTLSVTVKPAGNGQPVQIQNPYLAMRWCIALQGVYPPRP